MTARGRDAGARVLAALAAVVLVLALVAGYVQRAGGNSDQFANRATVALRDDSLRSLVADKLTDEVVLKNQADLIAARPIIQSVASAIVGSRAFTELFRFAVRDVHRAVFDRDKDTVTLTVGDVGTVLAAALQKLRPSVADKVEASERVELYKDDVGSFSAKAVHITHEVRFLAVLLLVLALVLVSAGLWLSPDRRQTVVHLGTAVAAGGVLLVVAYGVLRSIAVHHVQTPEERAAAGAVWDAFLGDLRTASWIMAGAGAVAAAAAASLLRPVDVRDPLRRAAAWVATEPRRPALRVVRAGALVAAGVLVIVEREAVLRLALTLAGVSLIFAGVTEVLRVIYRPPAPGEPERRVLAPFHWRRVAVPVVAVGLIAAGIAVFVGGGGTTTAAPSAGRCNGHAELCDRTLPEVVLPATHNSMSVPLKGWYSSEQNRPIPDQLSAGVRGLLIDPHYADRLPNGKLRTYFGSREELRKQAREGGISPQSVDSAMRIRERLGFRGKGKRGMYYCHTFCELGATSVATVLDEIHDFLVVHPNDLLVVVNEDYVSPKEFVAAMKKAGLEDLVYTAPASGEWPTLGEMIEQGERVIFLAEHHAGGAPWYQLAYKRITQETPFAFKKVRQLTDPSELPTSCKPNRGSRGAPIFLINHWVTTDPVPLPSNAAKVNAYKPLLRRAQECRRLRRHLPNLLAVNFYRDGDLFRVVDKLNRVR